MKTPAAVFLLFLCSACSVPIDIAGVDRQALFSKLYSRASSPDSSASFFSRKRRMSARKAGEYVGRYVEKLDGRAMRICVPGSAEGDVLDAESYNAANGECAAERAVEEIRKASQKRVSRKCCSGCGEACCSCCYLACSFCCESLVRNGIYSFLCCGLPGSCVGCYLGGPFGVLLGIPCGLVCAPVCYTVCNERCCCDKRFRDA